ncbi:hypothetical protein QJQ45_007129 [Haematococcus lacustris]|nr:hypothetical protein QJQ45_007129 [Haematococcus lacustris]
MSLVAQCFQEAAQYRGVRAASEKTKRKLTAHSALLTSLLLMPAQVMKVPGGAVPRGCKKTKRKLMAHFQLRAEVHSQLRIIASLFVLRIFLTYLVGYPTPGSHSATEPPAVQPPRAQDAAPLPQLPLCVPAQPASMAMDCDPGPEPDPDPDPEPEPATAPPTLRPPSARLAARHPPPAAPTGPPVPLDSEDPVMLEQVLPPQAPRSSQEASQPAASQPGPSTPLPAKRSKRTKAEPAAEPNKGKGKAAKAKPAPQPGRWLDRDCNAALNMQRIGESRWRPLELCWWLEQGKLPAKGKEYPGLSYKRLRDKPPKAQQQQPAVAQ